MTLATSTTAGLASCSGSTYYGLHMVCVDGCVCLILFDYWLCVFFLGVVLFCSLSFGELVVILGFCLSIEKELTV